MDFGDYTILPDAIDISIKINMNLITKRVSEKYANLDSLDKILPAIDTGVKKGLGELSTTMLKKLDDYSKNVEKELRKDLKFYVEKRTQTGFSIVCESEQLLFIEFGTGIVGSWNPHPKKSFALETVGFTWQYDVNEHGYGGWVYYNKRTGQFEHTQGVVGSGFVYKTYMWGVRNRYKIIQKHIEQEMKKVR